MPIDSTLPAIGQSGDANHIIEPPLVFISDSDKRALQRLVGSSVSQDELPSLIRTIVSNVKPADIHKCLERSADAQAFIDVLDKVCDGTKLHRNEPNVNLFFVRL